MASPPTDFPVPPYAGSGSTADGPDGFDGLGGWTAKRLPRQVADGAERDAIPTLERYIGLLVYVTGTGRLHQWSGSAWLTLADIYAAPPKDLLLAKGDLYVARGPGAVFRKAVGPDGSALLSDSASVDGLRWGTQAPPPKRYAATTNVFATRASTTYGGTADAPAIIGVVVTQSRIAVVHYSARVNTATAGATGYAAPYIVGVTDIADELAIAAHAGNTTALIRTTVTFTTILAPGTYDFRAAFRRDGTGNVGVDSQRLEVILQ